jgi:hypothetical protein
VRGQMVSTESGVLPRQLQGLNFLPAVVTVAFPISSAVWILNDQCVWGMGSRDVRRLDPQAVAW